MPLQSRFDPLTRAAREAYIRRTGFESFAAGSETFDLSRQRCPSPSATAWRFGSARGGHDARTCRPTILSQHPRQTGDPDHDPAYRRRPPSGHGPRQFGGRTIDAPRRVTLPSCRVGRRAATAIRRSGLRRCPCPRVRFGHSRKRDEMGVGRAAKGCRHLRSRQFDRRLRAGARPTGPWPHVRVAQPAAVVAHGRRHQRRHLTGRAARHPPSAHPDRGGSLQGPAVGLGCRERGSQRRRRRIAPRHDLAPEPG